MRIIGLTGGIGSGKSAVAARLSEHGAELINADLIGHEVYRPGTAGWARVVEAFGRDVVAADGTIDRKKLGSIVFADSSALAKLNAIVHPLIAEAVRERLEERRAAGGGRPIVVEAALLVEAGWDALVDEVWVVTAPRQAVIERVHAQRGLPEDEIAARIAAQLGEAERNRHASVILENSGSLQDLRARVDTAWERLTG